MSVKDRLAIRCVKSIFVLTNFLYLILWFGLKKNVLACWWFYHILSFAQVCHSHGRSVRRRYLWAALGASLLQKAIFAFGESELIFHASHIPPRGSVICDNLSKDTGKEDWLTWWIRAWRGSVRFFIIFYMILWYKIQINQTFGQWQHSILDYRMANNEFTSSAAIVSLAASGNDSDRC